MIMIKSLAMFVNLLVTTRCTAEAEPSPNVSCGEEKTSCGKHLQSVARDVIMKNDTGGVAMIEFYRKTISLGVLWGPTSGWGPFGPLDFVVCTLWALKQRDA